MTNDTELPNVREVLAPILARVARDQQPLLVAAAERLAADRYRAWAADTADAQRRTQLLACAAREEDIARRIEALYPDAAAVQRDLVARIPELELQTIYRSLFLDRSVAQQFAIQASGERLGAATWRAFAAHAHSDEARTTFLACAELEEESAAVLESFIAHRAAGAR